MVAFVGRCLNHVPHLEEVRLEAGDLFSDGKHARTERADVAISDVESPYEPSNSVPIRFIITM
ncbi:MULTISPECIES: hypothetical protein [Paraburkholderia]|uniref:Uncharacterized protein n=1 Tax=Paraburkholderia caribensis TaxID=75105 RepID=A0ABV0EAV5_9BURK|nr:MULTISPECIES: hypothetical protein [Paraburkholderia]MCO4883008.1 hypothetical protein [Paraburkholderia caribensis]